MLKLCLTKNCINVILGRKSFRFADEMINYKRKEVRYMRKIVSFMLALVLSLSLAVPAAATMSNQGGNEGGEPTAPKTGSSIVAVLALTTCAAGGVGIAAYKKSKE